MSRHYLSEAGKSGRLLYMSEETRDFCRKVAVLVFPMALQNLINTGIASIDVIMLGRVGEKVLSGASLGAQVAFVMNLIVFGFCSRRCWIDYGKATSNYGTCGNTAGHYLYFRAVIISARNPFNLECAASQAS